MKRYDAVVTAILLRSMFRAKGNGGEYLARAEYIALVEECRLGSCLAIVRYSMTRNDVLGRQGCNFGILTRSWSCVR